MVAQEKATRPGCAAATAEVTPDKFCRVEDQSEIWEQALALGREIGSRLGSQLRM
ncbi:MAG: hypothetical protein KMY53_20470 [Desulfarculus sp.]|nr:hypothetical protein [Pseudomonadota bacterium]MBU4575511.1 hypothetical protein [Pseudomonadota bacterium]MBU4597462.1 hypothetical protein [Pseudomonadota bacterium]MBV1718124.1 hypothetical protein [Desulfarculus sp.]MBV1740544.1 hypothetical protein [Desulfarculus sp.]